MISIVILAIVFVLIAVRRIGNLKLQIWQIMLLGALGVLFTGQISLLDALQSINVDVMLFLFGMFVVGQALEESGYLAYLSYQAFRRARSSGTLLLVILFGVGIAAALLMNDTLAIVGTPVVLLLARKHGLDAKMLLLALAFAVTIGSVASPIGNPQNLLIALDGGIENPFVTFFRFLVVPTAMNLVACYLLIRLFYRDQFRKGVLNHSPESIQDRHLARLSQISLALLAALIVVKIGLVILRTGLDLPLTYIALLAALPILLFSPSRAKVLHKIDWCTLIFFAAMFVLMTSVWNAGFFQSILARLDVNIASIPVILVISVILSQLISNVPLVALYLPMLVHAGASAEEMVALAAGSTIAGNLLILGAASNVIIIQNAEKKAGETLTFWEFARVGVPLTIINGIVYRVFLI